MADKFTFTIKGLKELTNKFLKAGRNAQRNADLEARKLAETILKESQELVPVDTSTLKNSGRIIEDKGLKKSTFMVIYGNSQVDYAIIVHEDLQAHHRIGQAKYLSTPTNRLRRAAPRRIRNRVFGALR